MWSTLLYSILFFSSVRSVPVESSSISFPLHKRSNFGTSKLKPITNAKEISTSMVLVSEVLAKNTKGNTLAIKKTTVDKAPTAIVEQHGNDISYYLDLQIGSNQNFSVIIDTGSYYSWIYGKNCTSSVCTSHNQYDASASKTSNLTGKPFSIQYTTSTVSGSIFSDVFSFAGFETILDFGAADQAGNTFASFPIDGIMGLSASDYAPDTFPSILTTLKNQKLITERVFAVNLGVAEDSDDEGSITFGGVDPSKYDGDISYTNVQQGEILWTIPIDGTSVNGSPLDFGGNRSAVVDTGTTLLVMPPDDALKLHGRIAHSETDGTNFAIPCDSDVTITLQFNGVDWTITKENFIGNALKNNASMCATNVQGLNIQDSDWILGDTFLKTVYTVFDMDEQKVGFANKTVGSTTDTPKDSLVLASLSTVSSDSLSSSSTTTSASTKSKTASTSSSTSSLSTSSKSSNTSSATSHSTKSPVITSTTTSTSTSVVSISPAAAASISSPLTNISSITPSASASSNDHSGASSTCISTYTWLTVAFVLTLTVV